MVGSSGTSEFLKKLFEYNESIGITTTKVPRLGHKDVDLQLLFHEVTKRGGVAEVIQKKCWKDVASVFNFPPTCTNAGYTLRINYMKLLYPYELRFFQGLSEEEVKKRMDESGFSNPSAVPTIPTIAAAKAEKAKLKKTPTAPSFSSLNENSIPMKESLSLNPSLEYANSLLKKVPQSLIVIPNKEYTLLTKRTGGNTQTYLPAKRQCIADPEIFQQRKLVLSLESNNDDEIERALSTLILVGYNANIEIKPESGILECLLRMIYKTRPLPRPIPQKIFTKIGDNEPILFELEESNEIENYRTICNEFLTVCTSQTGKKIQRQSRIIKLLLNLSHITPNKSIIASHYIWPSLLMEFLQQDLYVKDIIDIFANISEFLILSEKCSTLPTIINLLYSDDWNLVMSALEFFKLNTTIEENKIVYDNIDEEFFTRIIELLCIPQIVEKQFFANIVIDYETANVIQITALAILHNIAMYRGICSKRLFQNKNRVDVLMALVDSPKDPSLSRRIAHLLLEFTEEEENISFLKDSFDKMVLLVVRNAPCAGFLNTILDKILPQPTSSSNFTETSPNQIIQDESTNSQMIM